MGTLVTRWSVGAPARPGREGRAWLVGHPLETWFIAVGLVVRLVFWQVTHRRFEDGLIIVTHARSVMEGHGLTHHPFEPAVAHPRWARMRRVRGRLGGVDRARQLVARG